VIWYKYADCSLYKRRFVFMVGDHAEYEKFVRRAHPEAEIDFGESVSDPARRIANAKTLSIDLRHYIWFPEWRKSNGMIAMLSHESLHAAYDALTDIGVTISRDSFEALTYYQQSILQAGLNAFDAYEKSRNAKRSRR
jgi:hypothetical protein